MAGRFYYAPVDAGYGELGRGLARGIEGATNQYAAMRERERRKPMEDLAEAATRAQLAQQGVRQGTAPTRDVQYDPGFQAPAPMQMPDFAEGPLFQQSEQAGVSTKLLPADHWMRKAPDLGGERFQGPVTIPDPDYVQLNPGFYMQTPEARARGQFETQRGFDETRARDAHALSQEFGDADAARTASIYQDILDGKEVTPDAVSRVPGLADSFLRSHKVGGPYEPVRGTPEWEAALERELRLRAKYAPPHGGTGTGPGGITATSLFTARARLAFDTMAALKWLDQQQVLGNIKPDAARAQRDQLLKERGFNSVEELSAIVRGAEQQGPPAPRTAAPNPFLFQNPLAGLGRGGTEPPMFSTPPLEDIPPHEEGNLLEGAGQDPFGDPFGDTGSFQLTPEVGDSLRTLVDGLPPEVQRRVLVGSGLTEQEADRLLGGGRNGTADLWRRIFGADGAGADHSFARAKVGLPPAAGRGTQR